MKTASLQELLSQLLGEIQDLRADQLLMSSALEKAGTKMSLADAEDLKKLFLQEAVKETEHISKRIKRLDD